MDRASEDILANVVSVLSRPYSDAKLYEERVELLRLTTSLLQRDTAYLLVWLLDTGANGREFRLDQVFACESGEDCRPPDDCAPFTGAKIPVKLNPVELNPVELNNGESLTPERIASAIGIDTPDNPVATWFAAKGLSRDQFVEVFEPLVSSNPVDDESRTAERDVGAIQILIDRSTPDHGAGIDDRRVFRIMAQAIAGRIESSRRHRIWTAQADLNREVSKLLPQSDPDEPAQGIEKRLDIAAEIVGRNSRARHVTINYLKSPACKQHWEGTYTKPDDGVPDMDPSICSLLTRQLNQGREAFTVVDMYDYAELQQVISTIPGSAKQWPRHKENTAWMGVPVMTEAIKCRGDAGATEPTESPICTIQAFSKTSPGFIYDAFSRTDFELAKTVAGALAPILPATELRLALQTISTRVTASEMAGEFDEGLIVDLAKQLLPCSTYAAVVKETGVSQATADYERGLLEANKDRIFAIEEDGILPIGSPVHGGTRHVFVRRLYRLDTHHAHLVVGLAGDEMPLYRRNIVRYLCQNVATYLSEEFRQEKNLRETVEVRHAVRSGLIGAIGHLTVAHQRFAQFKDKPKDLAYRRLVDAPALRRSLERARFFAEKTRILFEQSRYLLTTLTPEQLKITHFGIRELVNEVVSCVRPEAEGKGCTINHDPQIPRHHEFGHADRDLYYVLLFNVIENAVKYSFRNQPIQVTTQGSPNTWRIEVTNTGLPIPKERERSIFEPFTRGQAMTQPDSRRCGTGLGLTVAKHILETHDRDQRIRVDSRRSGDKAAITTFTLPLPRRTQAQQQGTTPCP